MARASSEDLGHVLPTVHIPTLLVYGDTDVRAPMGVAEDLHAAISGSTLAVLPETGHVCNIEAPEAFNAEMRNFLHGRPIRSQSSATPVARHRCRGSHGRPPAA